MIKPRPIMKLGIKLLISASLLWWVLRDIDFDAIIAKLGSVSPWSLGLPVVAIVLLGAVQAVRWQTVLEVLGGKLSYWHLNCITMLSFFFNQTLPSTVGGDLVRIYRSHKEGVALQTAVSSVFVDRGLGMMALLLICAASLPGLYGLSDGGLLWWSACALTGAGIAGGLLLLALPALPQAWVGWPLVREVVGLSRATWRLIGRRRQLVLSLLLSIFIQLVMILSLSYLGWLLKVPISFSQGLVIYPIVLLVSLAPVSIGGWGVREGAMVVGLGLVGVPKPTALSVSILFGLVMVFVGLIGGFLWAIERPLIRLAGNIPARDREN
jgi:uncharacterized membrane protein YbhN (UPF0104 family)